MESFTYHYVVFVLSLISCIVDRQHQRNLSRQDEETFCYTALEAAHVCRTIIPENRAWTQAHKEWCIRVDESKIADIVNEHYGQPIIPEHRQRLEKLFTDTDAEGFAVLDYEESTEEMTNALTKWLDVKGTTTISEFFNSRPTKVLDEILYVIRCQWHKDYEVMQNVDSTIITRRDYQPPVTDTINNLSLVFNMETVNG
jgi:hypothetical protein